MSEVNQLIDALAKELRAEQKRQDASAVTLYRMMSDGKRYSERADLCGFLAGVIERAMERTSNRDKGQS